MHKNTINFALVAVLAVVGCSGSSNNNPGNGGHGGNGGSGGAGGGNGGNGDGGAPPDMVQAGDMTDTTPIPAPSATHVGVTGVTGGLVTDGNQHAAYLLNPKTANSLTTGELHVTDATGKDTKVAASALLGGYFVAPDGKSLVYQQYSGTTGSLYWLDLTTAGATPKQVIASGVQMQPDQNGAPTSTPIPLSMTSLMTPTGHYFLLGLTVTTDYSSDLHVVDLHKGADVYSRPNGSYDYFQLVLPDDTMIFQDTANGMSSTSPPVQTLYWMSLTNVTAGSTATAITTHVSTFQPTIDNKTLIIQKTNGDLQTWDLTKKSGAPTTIATGAAKYTIGYAPNGPIAYLGADRSVHVLTTDGTKMLDLPASTAADVFGSITLAADNADVYFFQNVDTQDNRGTLMRSAVVSGATPSKVGDNVSLKDLQVFDNALVFLQNVDGLGQFGDAAMSARDGTGVKALGTKCNVGGMRGVDPGPNTWFAMHLTGGALSATNKPVDGSQAIAGGLAWVDYTGAAEASLDAMVHAGTYAFSDDGRDAVYVTGSAWNATASNYVGALKLLATRAPTMAIDGKLAGVSELGPIVSRSLFVNAPTATTAGVYFVKY
jgi:hypothetical protein